MPTRLHRGIIAVLESKGKELAALWPAPTILPDGGRAWYTASLLPFSHKTNQQQRTGRDMKAFTIMGRIIKAAYDELFLCIYLSVLWWLGTILIVTAAPATLGLHRVANRMANYRRVESSFFFEGARSHFKRSWLLYLIRIGVPVIVGINIWFYLRAESWIWMIAIFFAWLLVVSLMIGIYVFPLFWQQDDPDLALVLRNAAILTLQHPLYTILLMLFIGVIVALSAIPLIMIFLTPALVAIAANFGLVGLLQEMGLADEPPVVPRR
jgi:uncharacterized membrane protein YesL